MLVLSCYCVDDDRVAAAIAVNLSYVESMPIQTTFGLGGTQIDKQPFTLDLVRFIHLRIFSEGKTGPSTP